MRAGRRVLAGQHSCHPRTEAAIRAYEIGQRVGDRKARRELADEATKAYELGRQAGLDCSGDDDLNGVEEIADQFELYLAGYLDGDIPPAQGPSAPGFTAWMEGRRDGGHTVI